MKKSLFTFATAVLITAGFCSPDPAEALYRVGPGEACQGAPASSLSFAVNCGLPAGDEFNPTTPPLNTGEVDFDPGGISVEVKAQTCRQPWNSSTLTCSSYTSVTSSTVSAINPSIASFTSGSLLDYRYYHIEIGATGATVLGTFTNSTGF